MIYNNLYVWNKDTSSKQLILECDSRPVHIYSMMIEDSIFVNDIDGNISFYKYVKPSVDNYQLLFNVQKQEIWTFMLTITHVGIKIPTDVLNEIFKHLD